MENWGQAKEVGSQVLEGMCFGGRKQSEVGRGGVVLNIGRLGRGLLGDKWGDRGE